MYLTVLIMSVVINVFVVSADCVVVRIVVGLVVVCKFRLVGLLEYSISHI